MIVVAIASFNAIALQGAIIYIIAHGLFSVALFLILGYVEAREETRSLARLGGLGAANPKLAGALCIAALAALGLPGSGRIRGRADHSHRRLPSRLDVGGDPRADSDRPRVRLHAAPLPRHHERPQVADLPVRADLTWLEGLALAPVVLALVFVGVNPHPLTTFDPALYNATATTTVGVNR